jgi:hypothetical protein
MVPFMMCMTMHGKSSFTLPSNHLPTGLDLLDGLMCMCDGLLLNLHQQLHFVVFFGGRLERALQLRYFDTVSFIHITCMYTKIHL